MPADWWNHKINPILGYRVPPVLKQGQGISYQVPEVTLQKITKLN